MPPGFMALHGLLVLAAVAGPWTLCRRRPAGARRLLGAGLLVGLPLQLVVARWPWLLARTGWPDVVFVSELFVPLALLVATSAALAQERRAARVRTLLLAVPLVGAAWAATTLPLRAPDLRALDAPPRVKAGVVLQSAPSSCAAAAAATLLRALGVDPQATERDLAVACLTRPDRGTRDLGLFRGLARACPGRRVRFVAPARVEDLRAPCLVFCGLDPARVQEPLRAVLRDQAGWTEGVSHAVVLFAAHADTVELGDPRFGRERWPRAHFDALWSGRALVVLD